MNFRVGSWQVRPDMDTLVGKGEPCHLSPKAMDVLVCLARHQGQVVCKDELVDTVWRGTFVSDDALTRCVAELRRAFEDDAREPSVIRTIPKRGFTLLPEVAWEGDAAASAEVPPENAVTGSASKEEGGVSGYSKSKTASFAIFFIVIVALVTIFLYPLLHHNAAPVVHRIAVLPFANISGDPEQEYLAEGMTEQLITEMAHISAWQVISRTSVMGYKEAKLALPEVARKLGADWVMEGTVQRSEERIRVTAQLIDARTDTHLWSGSFDKEMSGVLALQRQMARTIATELDIKLSDKENARLNSPTHKVVPAAYDAYLTGRYFHERVQYAKAATYFEQAIHLDPNFAPAYVFFFEAKGMISYSLDIPPDPNDSFLMEAGQKAIELDPNFAEAHFVAGDIAFLYNWDWAKGEAEYRRAVELDPNSTGAAYHYAVALACLGRLNEAVAELRRGLHVDPVSVNLNLRLLNLLIESHQYKEAEVQFQKVIELDPERSSAYMLEARVKEYEGLYAEAIAANLTADRLAGVSTNQLSARTRAATAGGLKGYWKECAEEYVNHPEQTRTSPYLAAVLYVHAGELDKAMKLLEQAFQERSQRLPWIQVASVLDPLRSDPRFQDLVKRMNFPQ